MAKNISKSQLVNVTMKLILENGGSEALTIRDIAKELNCSHPNIYNYYKSLDDLMWDVLAEILKTMVETITRKTEESENENKFEAFIHEYVKFCFEKIAWYRVIWFDRIKGEPPERVKEILSMPSEKFPIKLMEFLPEIRKLENAQVTGEIINSYLLGEVGTYITGRAKINNIDEVIYRIESRIKKMTNALMAADNNEDTFNQWKT